MLPLLDNILSTTDSQDSDWSNIIPKYETKYNKISVPLQKIFSVFVLDVFVPNRIDWVLPKCIESLLSMSHSLTLSDSLLRVVNFTDIIPR